MSLPHLFRLTSRLPLASPSSLRLGSVRHGSVSLWNDDWKPGPYPTTPEARAAAAKKYGLIPEDYEAYPDDGMGWGDYPKLPEVGASAKDPYNNWDDPDLRRNYGEPMHIEWDSYTEDRFEPQSRQKGYWPNGQTYASMLRQTIAIISAWIITYILTYNLKADYAILPKQWPADATVLGHKHYTFELKDQECD